MGRSLGHAKHQLAMVVKPRARDTVKMPVAYRDVSWVGSNIGSVGKLQTNKKGSFSNVSSYASHLIET